MTHIKLKQHDLKNALHSLTRTKIDVVSFTKIGI
jgi:hypothetical protein